MAILGRFVEDAYGYYNEFILLKISTSIQTGRFLEEFRIFAQKYTSTQGKPLGSYIFGNWYFILLIERDFLSFPTRRESWWLGKRFKKKYFSARRSNEAWKMK